MNAPSKTWWFCPDGWLWLPALLLAAVGIAFIYSAASVHGLGDITYWYQHPFVRQIAALLLGLGIAVALCAFDYHVIDLATLFYSWSLVAGEPARAISLRQAATTAGLLGEGGVAHRALEDARLTLECFRHYIGRLSPREPAELPAD